ncbi:UPF0716 protein FxsA [Arenicella xantha]|uniref:UPF0716 protein FxsA n=2 Tax=Arenicella xantha TaxID=644221 RepID=A0A395JEL2_9GAMM|nr:UPF0716 protein FxsA [Arenicella xantha]
MPILEISALIRVAGVIGILNTVGFSLLTAMLGAYLVKQQGIATLAKLQEEAQAGRVPAQQMVEGVALLVAGAVLLTPGFITDILGFALLVPPIRIAIVNWVARRALANQTVRYEFRGSQTRAYDSRSNDHGNVIDGEYTSPSDDTK